MKKLMSALTIAASCCAPAHAVSTARDYPGWKTSERFQIANIDGYQETYSAQENIIFYVNGKSDKTNVEPASGFFVSAILYDTPRTSVASVKTAKVTYDPMKQAWKVAFTAPGASNAKTSEIQVHLFCGKAGSSCATTYGLSAQIEKILPLQIK